MNDQPLWVLLFFVVILFFNYSLIKFQTPSRKKGDDLVDFGFITEKGGLVDSIERLNRRHALYASTWLTLMLCIQVFWQSWIPESLLSSPFIGGISLFLLLTVAVDLASTFVKHNEVRKYG
jgi:preprotein translocase subunit SecY